MISCAYAFLFLNEKVWNSPKSYHQPASYDAKSGHVLHGHSPAYTSANEGNYRTSPKVSDPQRLVVLGNEPKNPFYGAYQLPSSRYFPKLDANLDIVSTSEKNFGSGTKIMAYCSRTLSTREIIDKIVDGQIPVIKTNKIIPDSTTVSEQQCWMRINEQWEKLLQFPQTKQNELVQNEICSSRDIISLAHQGLLSVTGIYSELAPENKGNVPIVNVRSPLALKDLVSRPQLYTVWREGKLNKVLVWYFGDLHIFQRKIGEHSWWPITKVGEEYNNVDILLHVMRKNLELFLGLDFQLQRNILLEKSAGRNQPYSSLVSLETKNKPAQIMAEISRVQIRRSDEPFYEFLNPPKFT